MERFPETGKVSNFKDRWKGFLVKISKKEGLKFSPRKKEKFSPSNKEIFTRKKERRKKKGEKNFLVKIAKKG